MTEDEFYEIMADNQWAFMARRAQAGEPYKLEATAELMITEVEIHLAEHAN